MADETADDVLGRQLEAGDHLCAFYRTPAERDLILIPFLAGGLDGGNRCTCVVDSCSPHDVLTALARYVDVDRHLDEGRLDVLDSDETYFAQAEFLPREMLRFWEAKAAASPSSGVVRNIGDMSWAHRDQPGVEKLALYESELNRVMDNVPQVNVCLYDMSRCSGELIIDVLKTHPKAMLGTMVIDNPYYIHPDEFVAQYAGDASLGGERG